MATSARLGYNGSLHEPGTRWQLLGNGRRAFNPVLMRFHSPDALSPFSRGGINAYAYCAGNPINFHDPSGRFALPWLMMGLSVLSGAGGGVAYAAMGSQDDGDDDGGGAMYGLIAGVVALGAVVGGVGILKTLAKARSRSRSPSSSPGLNVNAVPFVPSAPRLNPSASEFTPAAAFSGRQIAASAPFRSAKQHPPTILPPARAGHLPVKSVHTLYPPFHDTVRAIKSGRPYPRVDDGKVFENRGQRLPAAEKGYYTSFTAQWKKNADSRGKKRVVVGGPLEDPDVYYYTEDHFHSFGEVYIPAWWR